jgi:hypothetical protein
MHNGHAARGLAHPNYVNGNRSIYMKRLGQRLANYTVGLDDEDLNSLKNQAEVLTVRQLELCDQLGKMGPDWKGINLALTAVKHAKGERQEQAIEELEAKIKKGIDIAKSYRGTWSELQDVIRDYTTTVMAEHKRRVDLQLLLPLEQMNSLAAMMMEAGKRVMTDHPDLFVRFNNEILNLLPQPKQVESVVES